MGDNIRFGIRVSKIDMGISLGLASLTISTVKSAIYSSTLLSGELVSDG